MADNDMGGKGRRRRGWRAVAAAALLACILLALPGAATAEPVLKGKTHLRLSRDLMTALRVSGVRLVKLGQGRVRGRVVSLPIASGEVDLASGRGQLEHEGGFRLVAGRRAVSLTGLRLDTARRGLWGRVDGRWRRIAGFGRPRVRRAGFGDSIGIAALRLRAGVAALLDRRLGLAGLFAARRPLGSLGTGVRPQFDAIASGSLVLTLDPWTLAKLAAAGVTPAPYEMLVLDPRPPSYAASLAGGAIYPDLRGGSASIAGGFELSRERPATTLSWTGLSLSLETNRLSAEASLVTRSGERPQGTLPIASLDLSGATARIDRHRRKVRITGARAILEAPAAAQVNQAFAEAPAPATETPAPPALVAPPPRQLLSGGDPLGNVSLWMTGR